jgi:hypothetical protein
MKGYEETQCSIPMPVNADDMLQRRRFKMQKNGNAPAQLLHDEYRTVMVLPVRVKMPVYAALPLPKLPCQMA